MTARLPTERFFQWARRHGFVLLTHDLDFSRILALAGGRSPSVVLLRTHRLLPSDSATSLVEVLRRHAAEIETGAVVVVSPDRYRVRLLLASFRPVPPLRRSGPTGSEPLAVSIELALLHPSPRWSFVQRPAAL